MLGAIGSGLHGYKRSTLVFAVYIMDEAGGESDRLWKYSDGVSENLGASNSGAGATTRMHFTCSLVTATREQLTTCFALLHVVKAWPRGPQCENCICLHFEQWCATAVRSNAKQNVTALLPVLGKPVLHFLTSPPHHLPLAPLCSQIVLSVVTCH